VSALRAVDLDLLGGPRPAAAEASEALVARARDGDKSAFEELVRLTSPACYALAFRLVGNEDDARDVVQDAYLRAYRGLRRFRGEAGFATWLHRITVNCAATLLERRSKASCDQLDDLDDSAQLIERRSERDPESAASTADDRERLVEALGELPDQLRLVVVLRDVYDLSHREIAKELGISQAAAKVRLHRARRRLRERLFPGRRPKVEPEDPMPEDPMPEDPMSEHPMPEQPAPLVELEHSA
jgi:RNA polymerase sigma-70 factor (ECF subfamily)